MAELRCSCGAFPPDDARFCHKCGRPLRESSTEQPEAPPEFMPVVPPPIPLTQMPPAAPEIGFGDSAALRVCMMAAAISSLVQPLVAFLPGPLGGFGSIALLGATGVLAVILYRRRHPVAVSVLGGARLGWITGAFFFVISLVRLTIGVMLTDGAQLSREMQRIMQQAAAGPMDAEVKKTLMSSEAMAAMGLLVVLVMFVTMSMMASVGGALGAKYFGQRQSS